MNDQSYDLPTGDCKEYSIDFSNMSINTLFLTINAELPYFIGDFDIYEEIGRFNIESDILKYDISIGIFNITLRYTALNGLLISIIHNKNRYDNISEESLFTILRSNSPENILLGIEQNVHQSTEEVMTLLRNERLLKEERQNASIEMCTRERINARNQYIIDNPINTVLLLGQSQPEINWNELSRNTLC
jgi:hypothetical protein